VGLSLITELSDSGVGEEAAAEIEEVEGKVADERGGVRQGRQFGPEDIERDIPNVCVVQITAEEWLYRSKGSKDRFQASINESTAKGNGYCHVPNCKTTPP